MPRNGSGTYNLPLGNPVISGTAISTTWANPTFTDIAQALTQSLSRDGQTTPSTNLPMAGFKHLNVGVAANLNEYARASQVQDGSIIRCTETGSVDDHYEGTLPFGTTAFVNGQMIVYQFGLTNMTTTPTLSLNGGPQWSILREDGSAIVAGDCRENVPSRLMWNDTAWLLLGAVVAGGGGGSGAVDSFNGRTGTVILTSADIVAAQPYVPVNKAGDVMGGLLTLSGNASLNLHAVPLQQVNALIAAIPSVAGVATWNGRSGAVVMAGTDVVTALGYTPANKAGETFTGPVVLAADPTVPLQAATKQYVDAHGGGVNLKTQVFSANGTFTWPTNSDATPVDVVTVTVQAAGAGGSRGGGGNPAWGGAGAGQLIYKALYYRNGVATTAVTVGAAGVGATAASTAGTVGGDSSFGTFVASGGLASSAALGGTGGGLNGAAGGAGGNPGVIGNRPTVLDIAERSGSGGGGGGTTSNAAGGRGGPCQSNIGGAGGTGSGTAGGGGGGAASYFGNGGVGGNGSGATGTNGSAPAADSWGAGGGSGGAGSSNAGNGGNGIKGVVIVEFVLY